ncbi:Erlin-like protein [Drosera capensis]
MELLAGFRIPHSFSLRSCSRSILHQVPKGHVGAYWKGGALRETITNPGFHVTLPWIMHHEPIQVTLQTDPGMVFDQRLLGNFLKGLSNNPNLEGEPESLHDL